jgi:hypothetical protein
MPNKTKISIIAAVTLAQPLLFAGAAAADETDAKASEASGEGAKENARPNDEPSEKETFWNPRKKPAAQMAVAINPLALILGQFIGEFDYGLNERLSLNINADYWSLGLSYFDTTALGVGIGAQYFPSEVASSGPLYQGFYVYPSLQLASVSVKENILGTKASWVTVAPQAVVGWQWDWRPFTMRLGAGAAYYIGSVSSGYESDLHGLRFVLDGTFGLSFGS